MDAFGVEQAFKGKPFFQKRNMTAALFQGDLDGSNAPFRIGYHEGDFGGFG